MNRRALIKLGLASSSVFATGFLYKDLILQGNSSKPKNELSYLTPTQQQALEPLINAMIKTKDKNLSQNQIEQVLKGMDLAVGFLPPHTRDEIQLLLGLLNSRLFLFATSGVWTSMDQAQEADIEKILKSWNESNFRSLQIAYSGLRELIVETWYSIPGAWHQINYPGATF